MLRLNFPVNYDIHMVYNQGFIFCEYLTGYILIMSLLIHDISNLNMYFIYFNQYRKLEIMDYFSN